MVQKMLKGTELFIGAKYEKRFGHVVLCGLGGIFVEVLKDVSSGLAPLSYEEAFSMIRSLKSYKIIKGTRGRAEICRNHCAPVHSLALCNRDKGNGYQPIAGRRERGRGRRCPHPHRKELRFQHVNLFHKESLHGIYAVQALFFTFLMDDVFNAFFQ